MKYKIAGQKSETAFAPLECRADNGKRVISGYASTPDVDSYDEIMLPSCFEETLKQHPFDQFRVLLVNHRWRDLPIGQITTAEIRNDGLFVEASITKTTLADDVWQLIQDGTLKAFSIGFNPIKSEYDDETKITTHTKVQLLEISVVNVPANGHALFATAKAKGLRSFTEQHRDFEPEQTKGGLDMEPKEFKAAVDKAVDAKIVDVVAQTQEAVEKGLDVKIAAVKTDLQKTIAEIQEIAQGKSQTEKDEIVARLKKDEELLAQIEKQQRDFVMTNRPEHFVPPELIEDDAQKHPLGPDFGRMLYTPSPQWGKMADFHREWSDACNQVALVHACMKHNKQYMGPRSLRSWKRFDEIHADFTKALSATVTGFGDEWVPTLLSANLITLIEDAAVIAGMFRVLPMPSNPWDNPILTSAMSIYLYSEATVDYAEAIRRSTPGTGKRTMTAVGFGGASLISRDATEDSIIAGIPLLQAQIVKAFARGLDDAIINGDATATHRDTQHSMAAYDHRHAWDGLRHLANADGKEYNCQTVSAPNTAYWESEDIIEIIRLMGNVAQVSRWNDLVIIMSLDKYLTAMTWEKTISFHHFGPDTTLKVGPGAIKTLYGIPVFTSEFIRNDYTSAGIYTGASDDLSLCLVVYTPAFWRGTRRAFDLESEKILDTQQIKIVGTARHAFREMRAATTEYVVAAGINIP